MYFAKVWCIKIRKFLPAILFSHKKSAYFAKSVKERKEIKGMAFSPYRLMLDTAHCKPIPVMKTGFSLCSISNREKPVFITLEPCNENRFFPVWEKVHREPCSAPVLALYGIAV